MLPKEIDDDEAGEARAALSKTKESLRTFGQHSYYYAWSEEKKQQNAPPPKPPQLLPLLPPQTAQTAIEPGEHMARTEIVSRRPGEDWVDPPPPGGWMIVALLITLFGICGTGWLYTTEKFWGVEWVEELHEKLTYTLFGLVALHVGGVIFSSWRHGENLVAAMIHGRKRAPGERDVA